MISTAVRRLNVKQPKAQQIAISRRERARVFLDRKAFLIKEGAGSTGCRNAPAALRAKWKKARTQVVTGTPNMPALPAQWFTAYGALSSASGFFSHRRPPNPGVSGPKADIASSANLIPASGDQDHTLLPSAPARFVVAHQNVHRIPHPTLVTIGRNAPLSGGAGPGERTITFGKTEVKFLPAKG
jgi:hypothetical protein